MNVRTICLVLLCVLLIGMLAGCGGNSGADAIDRSVMPAWEGNYSSDARLDAIESYVKKYIPVYVNNLQTETVTFQLDFDAEDCGAVLLAPADGGSKSEVATVTDLTAEVSVSGSTVTVDIGWYFGAAPSVQSYKLWSYLLWVKDAAGVQHYYYFRVDYSYE